jgi:hypothetical protein
LRCGKSRSVPVEMGSFANRRGQSCLPGHARSAPKADLVLVHFRQALSRNQTPAAALRHPPTSGDHGGGDPLTSSVIGWEPRLSSERAALRKSCQRPRPTSSSDEVEVAPAPPHEPGIFNMRRRSLRHSLFVAAGIGGSTAFSIESAGEVRGRPSNFGEIPRIFRYSNFRYRSAARTDAVGDCWERRESHRCRDPMAGEEQADGG